MRRAAAKRLRNIAFDETREKWGPSPIISQRLREKFFAEVAKLYKSLKREWKDLNAKQRFTFKQ